MLITCITPNNKRDYLVEMTLEGLTSRGHKIICSSDCGEHKGVANDVWTNEVQTSDFTICFFGKVHVNKPPKRNLIDLSKRPIVYVDGSEWTYTGHRNPGQLQRAQANNDHYREEPWLDPQMLRVADIYLKRECYPDDVQKNIIPFPFASQSRHTLNVDCDKDIDVLCSFGQEQTGLRKEITIALRELSNKSPNLKIVTGIFPIKEYVTLLKRSRYIIDAWGGGNTCDRFFDIVGAKAIPITQRPQVIIPNEYSDGINVLFYSSIGEALDKISKLPSENDRRLMVDACVYHTKKFHSVTARAEQIENIVKGLNVR